MSDAIVNFGIAGAHGADVTALYDDAREARLAPMPALRATSLRHVRPVVPKRAAEARLAELERTLKTKRRKK